MCHFLTISVPGSAVPEVPEEFRRKIHFTEHRNQSVTEHAPSDWCSFTATSGGCSCDFYRGSDDSLDERSRLEKKYRKKGWSEAKIERSLKSQRAAPIRSEGLRKDMLGLVTALTNALGEIRLSLHWYSGDVETERFVLSDVGCASLKAFIRNTTALRHETTITITRE